MFDNFKCQSLDTLESGTISFDFCSDLYTSCFRRCRDYGECSFCVHHNKDLSFCANCYYNSSDRLRSISIECQNIQN